MPRITLIELIKYRQWTEELGFDREGLIQVKQARLYSLIQDLFWENNCFTLPFRYDYYIVISNGLKKSILYEITEKIKPHTPYGLKIASTIHKYPVIALDNAFHILKDKDFYYEEGFDEDNIVVAHVDLNKITELALQTSIYESYVEVVTVYKYIVEYAFKHGGIASYLGGDNVVVVLPEESYKSFLEVIPSYIKVGVGISRNARKALELAAKALAKIRSNNISENVIIYQDDSLTQ